MRTCKVLQTPVIETDGERFGSVERPLMAHFRAATHDHMDVIGSR